VRAALPKERFLENASANVAALENKAPQDEHAMLTHLDELNRGRKEVVSPVERLQHALHGWVAFAVMPVFAFANAGVPLGGVSFEHGGASVFFGVLVGLVLGKPMGILAASWVCVRLGLAALPRGVGWKGVLVVGLVGGIGFTMAIFVAQLAFTDAGVLDTAKVAVLAASVAAAAVGLAVGRVVLGTEQEAGSAASAEEAEASTSA
jgi:NhaA family Na+:H+ antiporter